MSHSQNDFYPVVIIGSGLAGLTAGLHLALRDTPPLILEADRLWPGGRLSGGEPDTFEYAGRVWSFKPDHGVHALWGNYDNMRVMLRDQLNTPLQPSPGEEWINRWGREVRRIEAGNAVRSRWLPAPFHYFQLLFHPQIWANITPLDFLSLPGLLVSILLTVGIDPMVEQNALNGLMMKEYFRGWTPNLKATFIGLAQNLLAADKDAISLSAFIAAMRFYTMLRRDAWRMDYLTTDSHTALVRPLLDKIETLGGKLASGMTAERLAQVEGGWRVVVEDSTYGGVRSLYAENIILAMNPDAARRLLTSSPSTAPLASQLIFPDSVGNLTVRLWYKVQPRAGTPGGMFTGDFLPDNYFWLDRLYDEFNDWAEMGGSALEIHIYKTGDIQQQSDQSILIQCVDEIQRAFPELRGNFVQGAVRRNSKNHPLFRVPTRESLHVETPWPAIFACGDWVGYPSPSFWMERAVVTGIASANAVLEKYGIETYPISDPQKPETPVRALTTFIHLMRRIFGPVLKWLARLRKRLAC